jgi:hypothetical protein
MTRAIIDRHHGDITRADHHGPGTNFVITPIGTSTDRCPWVSTAGRVGRKIGFVPCHSTS